MSTALHKRDSEVALQDANKKKPKQEAKTKKKKKKKGGRSEKGVTDDKGTKGKKSATGDQELDEDSDSKAKREQQPKKGVTGDNRGGNKNSKQGSASTTGKVEDLSEVFCPDCNEMGHKQNSEACPNRDAPQEVKDACKAAWKAGKPARRAESRKLKKIAEKNAAKEKWKAENGTNLMVATRKHENP